MKQTLIAMLALLAAGCHVTIDMPKKYQCPPGQESHATIEPADDESPTHIHKYIEYWCEPEYDPQAVESTDGED